MAQKKRWWSLIRIEHICVLIIGSVSIGIMLYFRAPVLKEDKYKSEPKVIIGAINRGQTFYYLAEQGFASDISSLQLQPDVPEETWNYSYRTEPLSDVAVQSVAIAKNPTLHVSYISLILLEQDSKNEAVTRRLWCESRKKIDQEPSSFSLPDHFKIEEVQCPDGYRSIWDDILPFP